MSMRFHSLGGPTLGEEADAEAPTGPVVAPDTDFYAPFVPIFAGIIGLVQTQTVKLIADVNTRLQPYLPPSAQSSSEFELTAYVSGPKAMRNADNELINRSMIKITATYDSVPFDPSLANDVDFLGQRYTITQVRRIPSAEAGIAWIIIAER